MGFDFPLSACRPAKAKLPPHRWVVMLAWLLAVLAAQASASSDKTAGAAPSPSAQTAALTAELESARQTLSRLQNDLAEAVKQAEVNKADNLADLQQRQQLAERFIFHAPARGALDASTGPSSQLLAAYRALIDQYALIERSIEAQKRAELTRTDSKMYYEMRVRSALPPKALKAYGLMELARQVRDQGQFAKALSLWEQAETLVKESFNEHIAAMAKWREDALKEAAKEREKSRVKVEAWLKNTMQSIPAGEFLMGSEQDSSDETPVHKVHVAAFSLSKTEVTFELYDLCVASSSCYYVPPDEGWGRGLRPVINLSYQDISQQFLPWLNGLTGRTYRLPTEAEWEYAARAGTSTEYAWGPNASCEQARFDGGAASPCWAKEGKNRGSLPVQSFKANGFGLFDMHGNVWEWVEDCWHANYQGAPDNGRAWQDGNCEIRVLRGGAWDYPATGMRAANRYYFSHKSRKNDYGFRLALSP